MNGMRNARDVIRVSTRSVSCLGSEQTSRQVLAQMTFIDNRRAAPSRSRSALIALSQKRGFLRQVDTVLATPTFDLIVVSEVDSKTSFPNARTAAL